jgi:type IV secretory pathway VirB4 component
MMISSGDKAFSQIAELDHAMDQLASGNFVLGEYHFTIAVYAPDQERCHSRSPPPARSSPTPASSR